jgi:GNAT superfamily N-acetyltransferase
MLRLFSFLYPHIFRYKEWHAALVVKVKELKDENGRLQDQIERLEKSLKLIVEPFKSDELIVAKVITDKQGNHVVITVTEEFEGFLDFINVTAYDVSPQGRQSVAWLHAKKYRGYLNITDFQSIRENVGIGSAVLKTLIQFVDYRNKISKETEVNIIFKNPFMYENIYGDLSSVDNGHFDKLIPFYKKHGFEISMDRLNKEGKIRRPVKINY